MNTLIAQASEALKKGYRQQARQLLDELVIREPRNKQAWLLLAETVEQHIERIDCLKIALSIDPDDVSVREQLCKQEPLTAQGPAGPGPIRKPGPASKKVSENKPKPATKPVFARNAGPTSKPGPPAARPGPASKSGPDPAIALPPDLSLPPESDWPEPEDPGAFKPDKKILLALVKMNPLNEEAWIQLSRQADSPAEAADCLRHAAEINPYNTIVKMRLANLLEILKNKKPEET